MKRESSVWESEREAQRQVDKQRGYTEEKMLASERELQDEVRESGAPKSARKIRSIGTFFKCGSSMRTSASFVRCTSILFIADDDDGDSCNDLNFIRLTSLHIRWSCRVGQGPAGQVATS